MSMDLTEGTAKMVRDAIADKGKKYTDVVAEAGIPYATFNRKVNGKRPGFTITELGDIATTLGIPVVELIPAQDAA